MKRSSFQSLPSSVKAAARQQLSKVAADAKRHVKPVPGVSTTDIYREIDKAVAEARRMLS